jgi:hypothetical protein
MVANSHLIPTFGAFQLRLWPTAAVNPTAFVVSAACFCGQKPIGNLFEPFAD